MGWGITIKDVCLNRVRINELEDKLEQNEDTLQRIKEEIIALSSSSPRQMEEGFTWEEYVVVKINDLYNNLIELSNESYLMKIALDNLENLIED